MAVSGSLQLLNKRLVLINTAQVIGGANDRGEFNVPIPQQLQDPAANDLVYKMYIQSLTLQNEQPGVDASNNRFTMQLSIQGAGTIPDGPIGDPIQVELPFGDFSASEIVDQVNFLLARQRRAALNNWILPKLATQGTRSEIIYIPQQEAPEATQEATLPFGTNGNYLCFVPQASNLPNAWNTNDRGNPTVANLLDFVRLTFTFVGRSNLLMGFPGMSTATLQAVGSGIATPQGAILYGFPNARGIVPEVMDDKTSLTPLNARPWRSQAPMLTDDFSEMHLETDLPTNNYEVRMQNGLNETHVTAVIPITGPLGTRVQYLDDKGINAAFQRNQSTLTRLRVKLTNKYGEKLTPSSDWSMVLAIEAYQDHWKTMQDIQMASQDYHGEQLKLAKLQLLNSYFHTQTGQTVPA